MAYGKHKSGWPVILLALAPLAMGASDCEVVTVLENRCVYDGKTLKLGDTVPATDGCNVCTCSEGGAVACTEKACAGSDTCEYEGTLVDAGESFPASDGCNTCTCGADGIVSCTKAYCPGSCEQDGTSYEEGESFPASDGCNTCTCGADGIVSCTKAYCPGTCEQDGTWYQEGESFPASDGCNTCTCGADGLITCTLRHCAPQCSLGGQSFSDGDDILCPDGCNRCTCRAGDGESAWVSTRIACPPLPKIEVCDPPANDEAQVKALYLEGDALALDLTYSGGCAEHPFRLCTDGSFAESFPVQLRAWVVDDLVGFDPCDAIPTVTRVFDLSPLRKLYEESYQASSGTITLNLQKSSVSYSF